MFAKIRKHLARYLLLSLVTSVSFISQVGAQTDAEPILIRINQVDVKPGMVDQFRAMHEDVWMPNQRSSGVPWRLTSRVILGNTMQMTVAVPIPNMAAIGGQEISSGTALERQLAGDMSMQTLQSRRSFVITSRPDMSMEAVPNTGLTTVVHFQVKAGKDVLFTAYWNDYVMPAMKASGVVGAQMFQTTSGGPAAEFYMLVPQDGFESLDGPGPFSSLTPEEGARMSAMGAELFDTWDTQLTRVDQELSYGLPGLQP